MADNQRDVMSETPQQRNNSTTDNDVTDQGGADSSDAERERVRSSNDRDQQLDREGITSRHNRGYDDAANGQTAPTDPDSAFSDVDRDDTQDS